MVERCDKEEEEEEEEGEDGEEEEGEEYNHWPSAYPATVPGWWVRGLLSVRWDLVARLSGASGRQF